jgi:hypothetical protein
VLLFDGHVDGFITVMTSRPAPKHAAHRARGP